MPSLSQSADDRRTRLLEIFRSLYPGHLPVALVRSPGRVNLIGEHIDYNDGLVLPIAIERDLWIVVAPSAGTCVDAWSPGFNPSQTSFDLREIPVSAGGEAEAYVRGVAAELIGHGMSARGAKLAIDSTIPPGAGLSSSAALEVGVAVALLIAADHPMPRREVADFCRDAEHGHVGVPCGIMDQYACALAEDNAALLIDCRDRSVRPIPWPWPDLRVLIVDSRIRRRLADGAYAQRVRECAEALAIIRSTHREIQSWRDVTQDHVASSKHTLNETLFRRALHVVTEIARTRAAVDAMDRGDAAALGRLINDSHASLRDNYEVSLPELDAIAAVLRECPGVHGARLTGAGFGGCVIALIERDCIEPATRRLVECNLAERAISTGPFGNDTWFDTRPVAGTSIETL